MSEVDLEGSKSRCGWGWGGTGLRLGGWEREACPTASTLPAPPTHITLTRFPAQTHHGLSGVKRRPERREGEKGACHKNKTLPPPKGLSEIKLMECVSIPSQGDWGEGWGGMWGLLSRLPSFSHIDHHGNQSPLLPR